MRRRSVLRAALALCALGVGLVSSPAPVDAASATKSGWWFRGTDPVSFVPPAAAPPALPGAPTPPEVPVAPPNAGEGELVVQGTPNGATAIAAITYLLTSGDSSPVLTITPSEGSNVPADAVILACRAPVDWEAPEPSPGTWQDKPLVDCGRSVNGIVAEDGSSITFALQPLVSGNDLDVVLTPGTTGQTTPAGAVGSSFNLTFNATEGAVLAVTPGSTSTGSSSGGSSTPSVSPSVTPSFSTPSAPSFTAPTTPVVQPALEPQDQAPSVPQVAAPPTQPVASAEDDTAQGVGFIILLLGAALAGWAYLTPDRPEDGSIGLGRFRRPAPEAVLQGAAATPPEPVVGGLGRFSRLRSGPPPSLS